MGYRIIETFIAVFSLLTATHAVSINHPASFFTDEKNVHSLNELLAGGDFATLEAFELAGLSVPDLIVSHGYPVEVHDVTTEDGYILQLHRIPYGRQCGPAEGKKVVLVQHGLLCDSSNWVMGGANKSLAYLLADACFDVWLGNARGNTYSRRHVSLDPVANKEQFWSFSFDEMGRHDLPANIDYILEVTGQDGIYYVGHSMGTTMFWICMAERPEYNSKIKLMSALAPISFTGSMISPIKYIAPFAGELQWLLKMIGLYEFFPSDEFYELAGKAFCNATSPYQPLCSNILFLLCGFDQDQIDPTMLPLMLEHLPAGTSVSTVIHYAQGVPSKAFRQYDFGREKNMEKYGQELPPDYDLTKITAPVAFYWAENDWLAAMADTERMAAILPNIQRNYRINHNFFNHLDFLIAKDLRTLVNDRVIEFMQSFE